MSNPLMSLRRMPLAARTRIIQNRTPVSTWKSPIIPRGHWSRFVVLSATMTTCIFKLPFLVNHFCSGRGAFRYSFNLRRLVFARYLNSFRRHEYLPSVLQSNGRPLMSLCRAKLLCVSGCCSLASEDTGTSGLLFKESSASVRHEPKASSVITWLTLSTTSSLQTNPILLSRKPSRWLWKGGVECHWISIASRQPPIFFWSWRVIFSLSCVTPEAVGAVSAVHVYQCPSSTHKSRQGHEKCCLV